MRAQAASKQAQTAQRTQRVPEAASAASDPHTRTAPGAQSISLPMRVHRILKGMRSQVMGLARRTAPSSLSKEK